MKRIIQILLLITGLISSLSQAMDIDAMPHVGKKAQDSFQFDYTYANFHRAFAIAPGGAWSWQAGKATVEEAKQTALNACSSYTQQKCVLYAVDDEVVFDRQQWKLLWGPYQTKKQAQSAETGLLLNNRFPDLQYTDPQGHKKSISDLKGKVVFIHFWGCWCPSCRYEFTALIDMYRVLKDVMGDQVEFVVLQVREPIERARNWAKTNNVDVLPLSDSGVRNDEDTDLYLKGGKRLADRKIARVFPASYVIDKHGTVIFSHMGSISNWTEYVPFFIDAVNNSGK